MDYWGVGNYIAIKKILEFDNRNNISVCAKSDTPLTFTYKILKPIDKNRIKINCGNKTDYLIDNYFRSFNVKKVDMIEIEKTDFKCR